MEIKPKKIRSIYIIYWLLLAYIITALIWWFIALMRQNEAMVVYKKNELIATQPGYAVQLSKLEDERRRKIAQYVGEGATFFLLIIAGAVFVFRAVRRQLKQGQQQQQFTMAITHELKTPIAVAKLNLETILKHRLEESKQLRLIQNSLQETNRLNDLCNNLLISYQIESGQALGIHEKMDLSALVAETVHTYQSRNTQRSINAFIEPHLEIIGDAVLIQLAISNLLDNAVKYSPKETPITIILNEQQLHTVLSVSDEGPGISAEEKQLVFNKFYRLGNRATQIAKGTGLGLYLVKKIILSHNASIDIKDNSAGGSTFEIKFRTHQR